MFNRSTSNPPTKMPTRKNDAAPMIFFIDQIHSESFQHPILPMPIRIDRILNKLPTLFIFPDQRSIIQYDGKEYSFDYQKIYQLFIKNILKYAEKKYRTVFYQEMNFKTVEKWWNKTVVLQSRIHSYSQDLSYILQSYLEAYLHFLQTNDLEASLIQHIDDIIKYANQRIEENKILIDYKGKELERALYKKKKENFYPDIFEVDIFDSEKQKTIRKAFVPVFIYDDLLECYLYNKKMIDPQGYDQLRSIEQPKTSEKNSSKKWWQKGNKNNTPPANGSANSTDSDSTADDNEKLEPVNLVSFTELINEGILVPLDESISREINPENILKSIDIQQLFEDII